MPRGGDSMSAVSNVVQGMLRSFKSVLRASKGEDA